MKKSLLTLSFLWLWTLIFAGCESNVTVETNNQFDLHDEFGRLEACADKVGFYLNTNDFSVSWDDESEGWASFVRNGHVEYTKQWESAEDDVECIVDMVDSSVNIEFSNHIYNGELQEEVVIDSSSEIYSEEELASAEEVIRNEWFWKLEVAVEDIEIQYWGDEKAQQELEYCKELDPTIDQCAAFLSSFYIPEQDAQMAGAFEPDTTLTGYQWYLWRTGTGEWKILTAGY